jgi:hypothetical protein
VPLVIAWDEFPASLPGPVSAIAPAGSQFSKPAIAATSFRVGCARASEPPGAWEALCAVGVREFVVVASSAAKALPAVPAAPMLCLVAYSLPVPGVPWRPARAFFWPAVGKRESFPAATWVNPVTYILRCRVAESEIRASRDGIDQDPRDWKLTRAFQQRLTSARKVLIHHYPADPQSP